jgi:tetratricopeptide (TPR) repeat protein
MMRPATALALLLLAGRAYPQQVVPESVLTRRPNPFVALGGRTLVMRHLKPLHGAPAGEFRFEAGDSIGVVDSYPPHLSERHDETLKQASSLYDQRRYAEAAALLEPASSDEPDNAFVLNAYARALFWIDGRRDRSFEVYRRLIALLDREGGTGDSVVSVDLWFSEAYWKIASLYLDRRDYKGAAFELSRFLVTNPSRESRVLRQVFDYLVEAYAHLGDTELARFWAARALRLDPTDGYVLGLLYEMGPRAAVRAPTDALACRVAADSSAAIGAYSLYRDKTGFHCVVDRVDEDGTIAPCLRIGWIYVGLERREVERVLGTAWKSLRHDADGHDIAIYLVFQDREHRRGAYYAVEFEPAGEHQIAQSVQLTQDPPPLPMDLSCLQLGDSPDRVTRQLGPPDHTEAFEDRSIPLRGSRWDYGGAPMSIEIVDGKVYSLKVWRPDALPPKERRLKVSPPR